MPSNGQFSPKAVARRNAVLSAALVVWIGAVAVGFGIVVRYSFAAGAVDAAPDQAAPSVPEFERTERRHTLVVAAHPHCPCTRATMSELERLAPLVADELQMRVLLFLPNDAPDTWADGAIRDAAERLPHATLEFDRDGRKAHSMGARTSGFVVLHAPDGRAVFRGGLTIARGHEGASRGRRAIVDWIRTGAGASNAPVFGCALIEDAADVLPGESS